MYLLRSVEPSADGLSATLNSICHCSGMHIIEIPGTHNMTIAQVEAEGFTDSEGMYHDKPADNGTRATLVDESGKTAGVWVDSCEAKLMRTYFPNHPTNTLCWVFEVRVPEKRPR